MFVFLGCLVLFCPHCYMCYLYNKEGESCWVPFCGAGILPLRIKHRVMHKIMVIIIFYLSLIKKLFIMLYTLNT